MSNAQFQSPTSAEKKEHSEVIVINPRERLRELRRSREPSILSNSPPTTGQNVARQSIDHQIFPPGAQSQIQTPQDECHPSSGSIENFNRDSSQTKASPSQTLQSMPNQASIHTTIQDSSNDKRPRSPQSTDLDSHTPKKRGPGRPKKDHSNTSTPSRVTASPSEMAGTNERPVSSNHEQRLPQYPTSNPPCSSQSQASPPKARSHLAEHVIDYIIIESRVPRFIAEE